MNRYCDAVVDDNTVYIRDKNTVVIYSYDVTGDRWSQLPGCVYENGPMAIINGWLTTVGGGHSNDLFSLTRESRGTRRRRWTKKFPSMPTTRWNTTAVCTGTALIVAGGWGAGGRVLSTVEVMNTENHQWSTATDLPEPMYLASTTIYRGQIYMLGGLNKDFTSTKSVYTCSVSALLQSCVQSSLEAIFERTSLVEKPRTWRRIADLPVTLSACESFHGRLLAIGGEMDSEKATTAVYTYSSATDSWETVSHMTTGRCNCFTAVLPDNRLMVVGGVTDYHTTDTVEFVSVYNY